MGVLVLQSNKISDYVQQVCQQIRWKKAHRIVSKEIEDHIIDQKSDFIAKGFEDDLATDKAILEMGDPVEVGTDLDSIYRPNPEWRIILLTSLMLILGVVISSFITYDYQMPWKLTNSIISIIIGTGFMILAYFMDYSIIGKNSKKLYFALTVLTILVLLNGPILRGQNYYVKYIMLLFPTVFAGIVYSLRNKGYMGIILSGLYFIVPALICLYVPSFSSLIMYSLTCLLVITYAIAKGWFNINKVKGLLLVYIPVAIVSITSIALLVIENSYKLNRLKVAFNPYLDSMNMGWMGTVTRDILKNAKFVGQNRYSMNIESMLPSIDTDYLLTYLIDRVGWISFIVIISLILMFIIRSLKINLSQKGVLGGLVSISVISTFTMQVIFYVIHNLGFQLFDPFILPLLSYSRIGTIINMALIGIMLSTYRSSVLYKNDDWLIPKSTRKLFQFEDGRIIIDLNK